jgi:predicted enzyme related to lactoylglutathione lyase
VAVAVAVAAWHGGVRVQIRSLEADGMEVLNSRIIIHPSDLDGSLAFYGEVLNLPVAREFGEGNGRGVVFFAGGGLIEVVGDGTSSQILPSEQAVPGAGPRVTLWLQVRAIAATVDELSARGVTVVRPPVLEPWGLIEAWIDDPDGLRLHLVEVPADHPLRRDRRGPAVPGGQR